MGAALQRGRRGRIEFALQPRTPSGAERGADGGASVHGAGRPGSGAQQGGDAGAAPIYRREIASRWSVSVAERTVGKLLRRLRMTRLQPRPYHPKKDPAAQETYKRNFPSLVAEALPASAAGKPIEIWFQDEARVGQKGSLEYIWAPIGSRPPMVRDNRHDRSTYLARSATRVVSARQSSPTTNTEAMNEHLKEISTQVSPGAHAVLVCDGAGWHQQGKRLRTPHNITLLRLPSYSPELNPMENIWDYLRGNKLSRLVWDNYEAIVAACKEAWYFLIGDKERIDSSPAAPGHGSIVGRLVSVGAAVGFRRTTETCATCGTVQVGTKSG